MWCRSRNLVICIKCDWDIRNSEILHLESAIKFIVTSVIFYLNNTCHRFNILGFHIKNKHEQLNKEMTHMINQSTDIIKKAYTAFNERNIDNALSTMQEDVQWSKAWEGGYIIGHNEIKEYWTRQWNEINPKVQPVGFTERENGSLEVKVHQHVKDLQGNLVFDGMVKHIYTFQDGLIKTMDIELFENN